MPGIITEERMDTSERRKILQETHPIFRHEKPVPMNWETYSEIFQEVITREGGWSDTVVRGLAHDIFRRTGVHPQSVIFTLTWANGYRDFVGFRDEEDGLIVHHHPLSHKLWSWRPRHGVAQKFHRELCDFPFRKNGKSAARSRQWFDLYLHPDVFTTVFWFFSPERGNIPEHNRNHYDRVTREFLIDFVRIVWAVGSAHGDSHSNLSPEAKEMCRAARPKILKILFVMGRLDCLSHENPDEFDDELIFNLKKFARRHTWSDEPVFETIEEGAAAGNLAAEFLVLLKVKQKQHELRNGKEAEARKEPFLGTCPECGSGQLAYEEGCLKCPVCGYHECG